MGLWSALLGELRAEGPKPAHDDFWYRQAGWGHPTTAGVAITPDSAMTIATYFACVRVIAETVGSLPLHTYRRQADGGKERVGVGRLTTLLHDQPNPRLTSMEFREMLSAWAVSTGDGFAEIVPLPGEPIGWLEPIHPTRVTVEQLSNGHLQYRVRPGAGEPGEERIIPAERMFHLRGLTLNGVHGVSVATYARETLGLARAAQDHGARYFGKGARPGC